VIPHWLPKLDIENITQQAIIDITKCLGQDAYYTNFKIVYNSDHCISSSAWIATTPKVWLLSTWMLQNGIWNTK